MTFPLWYILVPYSAIIFFAGLFLFFNLFHMLRYGVEASKTYGLLAAYLGGFCLILALSAIMLVPFDWNYEISPMDFLPFGSDSLGNYGL